MSQDGSLGNNSDFVTSQRHIVTSQGIIKKAVPWRTACT